EWGQGLHTLWRTGRPGPELAQAQATFEALLADYPSRMSVRVNLVGVLVDRAEWETDLEAAAAEALIDMAARRIEPVAEVYPNDYHYYTGRIERLRHERSARRADPRRLARAERETERALELYDTAT